MSNITRRDLMAGAAGLAAGAAARRCSAAPAFAQARADLHAGGGRLPAPAALGALRQGRGGGLERQHQAVHRGDRRRRCGSTRRAGRTSARRPRSPPMSAPGPDMVMSWFDDPFQYPDKLIDVTELADELGRQTAAGTTARRLRRARRQVHRHAALRHRQRHLLPRQPCARRRASRSSRKDSAGFLELCKALKANSTPAGFPHGKAVGDGNNYAHWLLWSHGGKMINEDGKRRHRQPETSRRQQYAKELYETFIPGTESWLDINNNRAFLAGQVSLTANGVSLYYAAKKDPALAEIADGHPHHQPADRPGRPVGRAAPDHLDLDLQPHEVPEGGAWPTCSSCTTAADERLDRGRERLLLRGAARPSPTTRSGPRSRSTRPTQAPRRRCGRTAMPGRSATPRRR